MGPSFPLIISFWVLLFFTFFRNSMMEALSKVFGGMIKVGDIEVDEDLDNYYKALDNHDREWSI